MFEMTPQQTALVGAILFFFPMAFQYLQLLLAHPWIAPWASKIGEWFTAHVPLTGDQLKTGFASALAILVIVLTAIPVFPSFPTDATFTAEWVTLLFTWAANMFLSLIAVGKTLQLFYEHFWKNLFGGALATHRIEKLAEENA